MKSDAIAFGVAGIAFGLVAGWVIGTQEAKRGPQVVPTPPAQSSTAPAGGSTAAILDENKVAAFKSVAEKEPTNPTPRTELGNLYMDAEKYDEAAKWYAESLKLAPKDADVSTDLGICLYMTQQFDKALTQFDHSLSIDPKHLKTLLNIGVVRAFGKQDLAGAEKAWQQVVDIAPNSEEAQRAKRALESIRSAHPNTTTTPGN
ncbi:MAG TPA: tetratricopeptide repeat protein [Vicinamibacterales bacterium]|nr:tetratricopeptide repeat protein [Vicinamibacterales bacterium]